MVEKDSAWGFVGFVLFLVSGFVYYKLLWWFGWKKSRGTLPMYGQSWTSSNGRRLYVISIQGGASAIEGELAVQFTDVDPTVHEAYTSWTWPISRWRRTVDENQMMLEVSPWFTEKG